jgi:hypothetical protein
VSVRGIDATSGHVHIFFHLFMTLEGETKFLKHLKMESLVAHFFRFEQITVTQFTDDPQSMRNKKWKTSLTQFPTAVFPSQCYFPITMFTLLSIDLFSIKQRERSFQAN